jgi:hypothetical protein
MAHAPRLLERRSGKANYKLRAAPRKRLYLRTIIVCRILIGQLSRRVSSLRLRPFFRPCFPSVGDDCTAAIFVGAHGHTPSGCVDVEDETIAAGRALARPRRGIRRRFSPFGVIFSPVGPRFRTPHVSTAARRKRLYSRTIIVCRILIGQLSRRMSSSMLKAVFGPCFPSLGADCIAAIFVGAHGHTPMLCRC